MDGDRRGRAPDYTTACVVMFGVNLGWVLLTLFALWGLPAAMAAGFLLNRWIGRIAARRQTEAAARR
ncbi:hypothetical protein AB1M95_12495 [Sulfitobacter sp. LCG007]